jgi:hypothetical protein
MTTLGWIVFYFVGAVLSYGLYKQGGLSAGFRWGQIEEGLAWFVGAFSWLGVFLNLLVIVLSFCFVPGFKVRKIGLCFRIPKEENE